MKVITIVGARPQFIKCALVSEKLKQRGHEEVLVHTGQHYDQMMSGSFFNELKIPQPIYNLGVRSSHQGEQTGNMLDRIETVLMDEGADVMLVYGDTNSTLAGALAAAKLHIPIAHVEAGCRSWDRTMSEEINRVITDYMSTLHFCPTETACNNLFEEGVIGSPRMVGDLQLEMVNTYRYLFECVPKICDDPYILMTLHRPSNVDCEDAMDMIMDNIGDLSTQIIFPAHPRTIKNLFKFGNVIPPNVQLVDPMGYIELLGAMNNAEHVITDSGGVQKEAYFLGIPCTTVRPTTEWPETLVDDWNTLQAPDTVNLGILRVKPNIPRLLNQFGNGNTSALIVDELEEWYGANGTSN